MGSPKISLQFVGLLHRLFIISFEGGNQLLSLGLLNGLGFDDFLLLRDEDCYSGDLLGDSSGGSGCGAGALLLDQVLLLALKSGDG